MANKPTNQDALLALRHTAEHILTQAMQELYGKDKIIPAMGPATEEGFYFDFDTPEGFALSEKDFKDIEKQMQKIVNRKLPLRQEIVSYEKAKEMFANNPYKLERIEEYGKESGKVSLYWTGDEFVDVCAGPHVENTGEVKAFKLLKFAGAYWRGNEKNKMLTRIYGTAFPTKEELDAYLHMLEEAKKRDHRVLGQKLDLFHIDEKVGLGLPLRHPKGAMLRRVIEDFWYQEHLKAGYQLVRTPHIGNKVLRETSGHWGFYNESMYPPLEVGQTLKEAQENQKPKESEVYLLKPMNCPFHVQIYNSSIRSYRDLPMRRAECGTVYRFEKKGQLNGLTRVRGFTQDDAHIICRADQVEDELKKVIDFILFMYKSFGFDINDVHVYLSLRDPNNKEKYAGSDEGWEFTQAVLEKVAKEKNLNYTKEEGEAAFYGPKLDFKLKDVLGRLRQCSTLQFDFNLPARFGMKFTNSKGEQEQPYMLHRALFGSFERFIGLLIEHYAGAFPFWLAPEQIRIVPVVESVLTYAQEVLDKCKEQNFRVTIDDSTDSFAKKIRNAEMMKIPYIVVVGEKEMKERTVNVRVYKTKEQISMPLHVFIEEKTRERNEKKC